MDNPKVSMVKPFMRMLRIIHMWHVDWIIYKVKRKGMIKSITGNSFQKKVIVPGTLSLVQFIKKWNGACQIIEPAYQELSKVYEGSVRFFVADIEAEKKFAREYGITDVPVILFFKDGAVIDHSIGLTSKNKLACQIEKALQLFNINTSLPSKI